MPCANPNPKRELSATTKQAKSHGLWGIGRKNGKRSGGGKPKFGLKDLVRTVDGGGTPRAGRGRTARCLLTKRA